MISSSLCIFMLGQTTLVRVLKEEKRNPECCWKSHFSKQCKWGISKTANLPRFWKALKVQQSENTPEGKGKFNSYLSAFSFHFSTYPWVFITQIMLMTKCIFIIWREGIDLQLLGQFIGKSDKNDMKE